MRPSGASDRDSRTGPPIIGLVRLELLGSVFGAGAAVMVIEILGTRIIGPVFGVSLFVWAALLTVTLGSLAIGYYAGGVVVDRAPSSRVLGIVITSAGALLGLVPAVSLSVLRATQGLGPRWGPLASATLLFGPCLATMGMIGPVAVRLATEDIRTTGHRVGGIYAVSTAGSLIGTLATSFAFIPAFESKHILIGTSFFLVILGAGPLVLRGRRAATLAIFFPFLSSAVPADRAPSGFRIVDRNQSLYGLVEVIDDLKRDVRFLRSDHSVIGAQFIRDRSPGFSFLYQLEFVRFLRPHAQDLLQIGLGIGWVPMALKPYGIRSDVVEIDPEVVRFARQYFDFSVAGDTFVEDARTFVARTNRRYDLIIHDTFTGGSTPEHLLSVEVIQRLNEILRPDGVLALNFAGYQQGPKAAASWAVARTLRDVFANVRVFRDSDPTDHPDDVTNMIFFASQTSMDFSVPDGARFESQASAATARSLKGWEVFQNVPDGPIVTDGLNPLARLQMPVAEDHFAAMNKLFPPEVWLQ